MKIRKERYQYSMSQEEFTDLTKKLIEEALISGYQQGIAEVLYLLTIKENHPWKKSGIQNLYRDIKNFNLLPPVAGQQITAESVIDLLKDRFEIDIYDLPLKIDLDFDVKKYLEAKKGH